jgi:hypothetical protein
MNKARDLLPWIMGGLMIVAVAAAIAVGSTYRDVPAKLGALGEIAAPLRPTGSPASIPAPPPGPESTPPTVPVLTPAPAAPVQTAALPVTSGGQIWECTINGVKTFSGKPCGAKASLREISAVNGMESTPALPYVSSEPESRYPPDYAYPEDQESARPPAQEVVHSYPVFIGIPVRERRRPDHAHRPVHGPYHTPPSPKN